MSVPQLLLHRLWPVTRTTGSSESESCLPLHPVYVAPRRHGPAPARDSSCRLVEPSVGHARIGPCRCLVLRLRVRSANPSCVGICKPGPLPGSDS